MQIEKTRQEICNVTMWCIHIITVAKEMQQCVLCTVEINIPLSTI